MAKNKNWFERLKRLFSSETKSKKDKKEKKRKKVWHFGRVSSRCPPPLPAPSAKPPKEAEEEEEEEEQNRHAVGVAAAAAAAAQVVRSNGGPPLSYPRAQELAAIKIETAFRALLARRALRALKGLVKLQALIRGQAVRRQTTATLRGLQSLMKIQSQARASRVRAEEDDWANEEKYMVYGKATGSTQNIHRRWDGSSLSKEELTVLLSSRREAATKRERALEYAFSRQERRRPMTPEFEKDFRERRRRWSWLEQWVGAQPLDRDMIPAEIFPSPRRDQKTQPRCLARRRSFTQSRRTSLRDYDSFSGSPSLPSYMASTASAEARSRSLSTPRQRHRHRQRQLGTIDLCSENCVPYAGGLLSPLASNASEAGRKLVEKGR